MSDQPDLTVDDVAARLQIHPETVRQYLRRGEFPSAYLLPGRSGYRIPPADLEAFKQRRRGAEPINPRDYQKRDE